MANREKITSQMCNKKPTTDKMLCVPYSKNPRAKRKVFEERRMKKIKPQGFGYDSNHT